MTGTIKLHTPWLVLRRHVAEDAEILHRVFGLDEAMYRYSGWNPYATANLAEETVQDFIGSYSREDFYGWAIEQDGQLVGTVGAYDFDPCTKSIEIGLSIRRVMEKAGMVLTGTEPDGLEVCGQVYDKLNFEYSAGDRLT